MNKFKYKMIVLVLVMLAPLMSSADIMEGFDSLGGNDVLLDRAKSLNPEAEIRVVQDRIVPRRWRHEFNVGYSNFIGGDSLVNTQSVNFDYHIHINPRWSVGAKYLKTYNGLSNEGEALVGTGGELKDRLKDDEAIIPELDEPTQGYLGVLNYYPIYGKLNMFNSGIVHFDVYLTLGYGQMELQSAASETYTVGGGVGFWISNHLTSRLELRQQFYDSERFTGKQQMNMTIATFSMGYML